MRSHPLLRVLFTIAAVLLAGCQTTSLMGADGIELTKDGAALGVIVTNGHTELPERVRGRILGVGRDTMKPPVHELQSYLEQMTGAKLPTVATLEEAGERPAIVLNVVAKVPGSSDRDTADHAYRIRTEGNRVVLTAANEFGLYNAVYGFLEDHLGCHYYSYKLERRAHGVSLYRGPGHEVIPNRPTLRIPAIDDFQEPALPSRGLIFRMGGYPWILKNRGIGVGGKTSGALASGHTMRSWLPAKDKMRGKKVMRKGLFDEHPEIFPMNKDGKRFPDDWNMGICGTSEKLPQILAQNILESLADKPHDYETLIGIGQGDGFNGCLCPDCRKLVEQEESEAAPLVLAFNRTLDIVNQQYPNVGIITFSYFNTLDAPKTLKPHDNLWINVVSSATSKNHAGDQMGLIEGNPANADYARALREWPRIAPNRVTVWHWDTYRAEWPSMFYVDDNVRYMVKCGVYGINPQTCGGPWDQMINWLYMKLNWDPTLDGDKLIMQYVEDTYGKAAAPYVYQYLERARDAYEDALHVPSAVRWAGWTRITMDKLFPESVRADLVALMDRAVEACEKRGTEEQLANLLEARRDSIDRVVMEAAARIGDWGLVEREDGVWYVAGADARVPDILRREHLAQANIVGISSSARGRGGPVLAVLGDDMTALVCPEVDGQVVGARMLGKQLLDARGAQAGYGDVFTRQTWHRLWLPAGTEIAEPKGAHWATLWQDYRNPTPDRLVTRTVLSGRAWKPAAALHRTVRITDAGLLVERRFDGDPKLGQTFSTRWRLALPEPKKSRVTVSGGGLKELMDLRYAEPGGIRTVQAGQRPPGYEGLDAMDEKWDAVQAVSDAQTVEFEVKQADGELQLLLDRGDGVAALVTTPAKGWAKVQIKPVVGEHYLELTLVGQAVEEETVEGLELPPQTLSAKAMPVGEAVAEQPAPKPQIKVTGPNTAINEIDGAELVWVPAGTFKRGSDHEVAGADERPVRDIYLDGYWVYKHQVTYGQFQKFCAATGKEFKAPWPQGMKARPEKDEGDYAVTLNWFQAQEYARWARGDLPTEAQWEKAARGTDGREYPWGNEWEPDKCVSMENTLYQFNEGFRPVGSYPAGASPCGALDMAGNVWEWTRDWYRYEYYAESPERNPTGPQHGANKVVRGGCSLYDWRFSRAAARFVQPPAVADWTAVGFRCVIEAPNPASK